MEPDEFDEFDEGRPGPLDRHETTMVRADLDELEQFEDVFAQNGYRGVAVFCPDCREEHYYPWDMMRENLQALLETGETPVHEPAYAPQPERYLPWEYARGYVDAMVEVGVHKRVDVDVCPACGHRLRGVNRYANFCARCGAALLRERLRAALEEAGLTGDDVTAVLRATGLPE
ncbi:MAG: DUF5319 family protein [Nitriliruptorales bacterium]